MENKELPKEWDEWSEFERTIWLSANTPKSVIDERMKAAKKEREEKRAKKRKE